MEHMRTVRTLGGGVVFVLALIAWGWGTAQPAHGQLTPGDIAALQAQARSEGWTFEVGANDATRRPLDELCGFEYAPDWEETAEFVTLWPTRDLPASYDWRVEVGNVPVRNQGGCGSCWAFGTVGVLEWAIKINEGLVVDLSEQWLLSCNHEGWSCEGGQWAHDYHMYESDACGGTGAVREFRFPYVAADVPCNCPYQHQYLIESWAYVTAPPGGDNIAAVKQAIMDFGPVGATVTVNAAFQGYNGGVFNACSSASVNHAVVLVGWDDSMGDNGAWLMRNSWGTGWGNAGYMWIAYGCSHIDEGCCFVNYLGEIGIEFAYPDGMPEIAAPNEPLTFPVQVVSGTAPGVPGTGMLHYSVAGSDWEAVPLVAVADNAYEATLPAGTCADYFDWYVSAEQSPGEVRTDPPGAPLNAYNTVVATGTTTLFHDRFEVDKGWEIGGVPLDGQWERAVPELVEWGGVAQPGADHSPGGAMCFVTGAAAGADPTLNDVDAGPAQLGSPTFELAGRDGIVSYWLWLYSDGDTDRVAVWISNNNGGSWSFVDTHFATSGWTYHSWAVSDYTIPTDEVRIFFQAFDFAPDSVMEVLIDDFELTGLGCAFPRGDLNCDGVVSAADIDPFVLALSGEAAYLAQVDGCDWLNADCNADGQVTAADIDPFVAALVGN
jgi:hypothetical protein